MLRPALRETASSPGISHSHDTKNPFDAPNTLNHSSAQLNASSPPSNRGVQFTDTAHLHPHSPNNHLYPSHSAMSHSHSHPGTGSPGLGIPRTSTQSSVDGSGRYRRKVGFEAFEAGPTALFAYTCQAKSEGYKRNRNTRVFAVAVSSDEAGEDALEWLMQELVEDGDEVVAIRVVELDEDDPRQQEGFREEAHRLLQDVLKKNDDADARKISVIVEFVAGRITEMLMKMISLYRPDSLIVGTKGRSKLQNWGMALGAPGMGSVSRYAVSHSPVPVIVVRPERKVKKTLEKRQADPKRGRYAALLGTEGLSLSRSRSRERSTGGGD